MAVELTVNGNVFQYPQPGEQPGWGEDSTAWSEAVTEVLDSLANANDILQTEFLLTNNQSSAANVNGLLFSTASVRTATIEYTVYISTSTQELAESGTMIVTYKNTAATWGIVQLSHLDDSGVIFSITNSGQVQYTTTNIAGTGYSGKLTFKAKTLAQ